MDKRNDVSYLKYPARYSEIKSWAMYIYLRRVINDIQTKHGMFYKTLRSFFTSFVYKVS